MAKKKTPKAATKAAEILVPFPAEQFPDHDPQPLPPQLPPAPVDFEVKCKITSLGTRYWSGLVFVAIEATDSQNLLDLLREGQEVVLHYNKEQATTT